MLTDTGGGAVGDGTPFLFTTGPLPLILCNQGNALDGSSSDLGLFLWMYTIISLAPVTACGFLLHGIKSGSPESDRLAPSPRGQEFKLTELGMNGPYIRHDQRRTRTESRMFRLQLYGHVLDGPLLLVYLE